MHRHLFLLLFLSFPVLVHAWDPDDETFDPTIEAVIADGSSRLGDPSPFYREGYEERGFTFVHSTKPEKGDATVNLAFILMPAADDPAKHLGGALYLPIKNAEALVDALEKGAELDKTHLVWEVGWAGKWTLRFEEEKGLVFLQEHQGHAVNYSLSVPAAKKLAGALRHALGEVKK